MVLKRGGTPILFVLLGLTAKNWSTVTIGSSIDLSYDRFVIVFIFRQIDSSNSRKNSSGSISNGTLRGVQLGQQQWKDQRRGQRCSWSIIPRSRLIVRSSFRIDDFGSAASATTTAVNRSAAGAGASAMEPRLIVAAAAKEQQRNGASTIDLIRWSLRRSGSVLIKLLPLLKANHTHTTLSH